jgi:hypothetical protein
MNLIVRLGTVTGKTQGLIKGPPELNPNPPTALYQFPG